MTAATEPQAQAGQTSLGTWMLGVGLALFVAGRCLVPMDETDLFYNLRLGEIILQTHGVPRTNLLSFTYPQVPDPNLAWVFQILLASVYRAGGIPGTVLLKTAFVVVTFSLLYRVAIHRGAHPAIAAATLALAAWAAEPRFVERPHLVTFLGLAVLLLALERAEAGRPTLLWCLVPLGVCWANANSCFFLAPALLFLYAAGALWDRAIAHARRAACVGLALCPLLFATPTGAGWMGYVANHFRMPYLRPLQEYRAAEWPLDGPFFLLVGALILVGLIPAIGQKWGRPAIPRVARHLLPIVALGLLGSRRIRFVAEFALCAGPAIAARGTVIIHRILHNAAPTANGDIARVPPARLSRPAWITPVATLVGLVLLTLVPRVRAARAGQPFIDIGLEDGLCPWSAIRWLDAHGLRDRLYNDLEVGSVLTWDGWPHHLVFQDPRINAYPDEFHAVLRRDDLDRETWEGLLARFDTTAALITYPDVNPRAALFDPNRWALVYSDPEALVFVRRDLAHARLIDADELPLTFQFDPASGVTSVPLDRMPPSVRLSVCEWQRRLGDVYVARQMLDQATAAYRRALNLNPKLSPSDASDPSNPNHNDGLDCLPPASREPARVAAAALALRMGEPQRAADLLAGLSVPGARTNRGYALVRLERNQEALSEFDEALRQRADDPEAAFGRALALDRLGRTGDAILALRAFLQRWPQHFATREARALLDRLLP